MYICIIHMQIGITWVTGISVAALFTCRIACAWGRQKIPTVVSTIKQNISYNIISEIMPDWCGGRESCAGATTLQRGACARVVGGMFGSLSLLLRLLSTRMWLHWRHSCLCFCFSCCFLFGQVTYLIVIVVDFWLFHIGVAVVIVVVAVAVAACRIQCN